MPATNRQLARIFQQMADVMEIRGENRFKVIAYQKAARCLDDLPEDITGMQQDELQCVQGIGKGLAAKIEEFVRTGQIAEHQKLIALVPEGVLRMSQIPGLGPKTVATLWEEGGVTDVPMLLAKIESGELETLPRLGKKKLEQIKKSIEYAQTASGRLRIGQAMPLAQWLVQQVKGFPGVERVEYAGSLRRGRDTIGDLDLVCAAPTKDAPAITERFTKLEIVSEVLGLGDTKASVRVGFAAGTLTTQVDLRVVPPDNYGAALLYFTGSKEHNVALRQRAIDMDLRLNEYGVFKDGGAEAGSGSGLLPLPGGGREGVEPEKARSRKKTKGESTLPPPLPEREGSSYLPPAVAGMTLVAARTEEDCYRALGLAYIPPELREDHGELLLAEKGALPTLVTIPDIKSELHSHTTASDGAWTIREWADVAIARGFHTIAITDHSKSQVQANGLTAARLAQHLEDVRRVAKDYKGRLTILAGTECDILSDGALDYPDELLAECDIVVASPHNPLKQEPEKATARLIRAIENPYVTILGHATGRLVNRREGLQPDMAAVVKAAAARGIAVEINANHHRLDVRDTHARLALEAGCVLAINCDAHGEADLGEIGYGVLTARRAGATPDRVVNCLDAAGLKKWIASTRR